MPRLDGYRLLQWVRERNFDIPFVLMTVKTSAIEPIWNSGFRPDAVLEKPFDRQDLLWAIKTVLRKGRRGKQGRKKKEIRP